MKTRAAILYTPNTPFKIESLDLEQPHAGEVLVKIAAAGVCHSDWHLVTGATQHPMPVVVGHEGAGIVEQVGDGVARVKPGDHVSLNWAPNCGGCFYCLHDRPSLCETYTEPIWAGTMMDSTPRLSIAGQPVYHYCGLACFAEFAVVPQESCIPLPQEVPFDVAALIGCAVTTGVGAAINTARVHPGSSVAVFGVGGVGLSIIMGAKLAGASQIIAVDRTQAKKELARSFGATEFLFAGPLVTESIRNLTDGRGVDYVFEAVGSPEVQEQSFDAARPGGTVVFAGLSPMGSSTNLPGSVITRKEITIMGSYYGTTNTARDFPLFADLYLKGKLDLGRLISKRYTLDGINLAYEDMLKGEIARGVIIF